MTKTRLGRTELPEDRPFLILEAGVNHEGSLATALEMIDAAAEAGADAIKFQSYKAQTLACRESPAYWDRSKEPAHSQFELFQRYDVFDDDHYRALAERCVERNIVFCSTPFDDHFVHVLEPLMPFFKVASADITNFLLLETIAGMGKPVLLSTGASYLSEVDEAVRFLRGHGVSEIALLHCVLEYPTAPEHANLRTIPYLGKVFPECLVGYSDHVPPHHGCQALLTAWMLGARILEKHFTLDKSLPGNDHYHAMDPEDVRTFLAHQKEAAKLLGSAAATCLPCEAPAREHARRSLVASRDIPQGEVITRDALTAKRPGGGIGPNYLLSVMGRRALRDIPADSVLRWTDLR